MATQQPAAASTSVILREVVLLYPAVFEKRAVKGSSNDPKFSTVVLLPATYDLTPLKKALLAAATSKFGNDAAAQIQKGSIKLPFRRQSEKAAEGKDGYSEDPNAIYLNVSSDNQPGVVDQRRQPVIDPDLVYGGVVANVQINAYAWQHPLSGKGLSFGLQNIQIVRNGPRLGNQNPDPSKVFDDVDMPAGEAPPPRTGEQTDADIRSLFG